MLSGDLEHVGFCYFIISTMVGAARILPLYFLCMVKGDQEGLSEGFGNFLLCILSLEKIGHKGGGESKVSCTLYILSWLLSINEDKSQVYS